MKGEGRGERGERREERGEGREERGEEGERGEGREERGEEGERGERREEKGEGRGRGEGRGEKGEGRRRQEGLTMTTLPKPPDPIGSISSKSLLYLETLKKKVTCTTPPSPHKNSKNLLSKKKKNPLGIPKICSA
jgi:hypothetical protein